MHKWLQPRNRLDNVCLSAKIHSNAEFQKKRPNTHGNTAMKYLSAGLRRHIMFITTTAER